jgi:hypothetical protein
MDINEIKELMKEHNNLEYENERLTEFVSYDLSKGQKHFLSITGENGRIHGYNPIITLPAETTLRIVNEKIELNNKRLKEIESVTFIE